MSDDAKRYMICGGGAHEAPGGTWVRADDYDRLRAEVERLEKLHELDGKDMDAVIHFLRDNGFIYSPSAPGIKYRLNGTLITDEQIDAAWLVACVNENLGTAGLFAALRELGIVACPECGGSGRRIDLPDRACKGCHGHGWIREEHGDE